MSESPIIESDSELPGCLRLSGDWQVDSVAQAKARIDRLQSRAERLDASRIQRLDAAGAWLLVRLAERLGVEIADIELNQEHRALVETVARAEQDADPPEQAREPAWRRIVGGVGRMTVDGGHHFMKLTGFLGMSLAALVSILPHPSRWPLTATVHHMQQTGLNALPLVVLLSFLVGAVVAFLGATVLRDFGAELFVVDLITYAFLREFGVLLTAILLAGRTASAFTAQIGTMKSREEIDAIRTLGLDPIVLLVLPRLIALLIMLPVLAVAATLAGLLGGLTVSVVSLGIPVDLFLARVEETIALRHYLVGLIKAPMFALVIALVGCLEGFKVAGTAQSVGERTTSAVVQSISLVIIIDALAAIFFMEIGW
jgi:phospholipid/cholesterol/gamma-HCH transport system permease protein